MRISKVLLFILPLLCAAAAARAAENSIVIADFSTWIAA